MPEFTLADVNRNAKKRRPKTSKLLKSDKDRRVSSRVSISVQFLYFFFCEHGEAQTSSAQSGTDV